MARLWVEYHVLVMFLVCSMVQPQNLRFNLSNNVLSLCPTNCTCSLSDTKLKIDCSKRPAIVSNISLVEEFDLLLEEIGPLSELEISNSYLTEIPVTLCSHVELRSISLSRNQLIRLPDDCINRLRNLIVFTADWNNIFELQVNCDCIFGICPTLCIWTV